MTATRHRVRHHVPRRRWIFALLLASVIHVVALISLRVPADERAVLPVTDFVLVTPAPDPGRRLEPASPPPPSTDQPLTVPLSAEREPVPRSKPSMAPHAPLSRTIPRTTLRVVTQPLVAGAVGIHRRRIPIDTERRAIARAESLVNARMASLPGARSAPERTVELADGGGVTIRTPWPGFLPADLEDERWRHDRCERGKGADGDKPGETEGRSAQC